MKKVQLSTKQQEIVNYDEGAYLVLASAGSGKTRVLTERIKRLAAKDEGRILAITFTNKAALELRERLGSNDLVRKNVFIGTFHSFCQSIIQLRYKFLGYQQCPQIYENHEDCLQLIKQAITSNLTIKTSYDKLCPNEKGVYHYKALQFISNVKRNLVPVENLDIEHQYLYKEYQDQLEQNNAIDFDDIIRLVYMLFINNKAIVKLYRQTYKFICIDESQDLNKLQYYLLKALCGDVIKNVMMVGDPNQSIYAFNGSSPIYMQQEFKKDFNVKEVELTKNYRSSSTIVHLSNKLLGISDVKEDYALQGITEIRPFESEEEEASFVIEKIHELVKKKVYDDIEGDITYNSIAILARNKYVFKAVEEKLKEQNIPYYYKSGNLSLKFTSDFMRIFDYYFRLKINPLDKLHENKLKDMLGVNDIYSEKELLAQGHTIAYCLAQIVEHLTIQNLDLKINKLKTIAQENLPKNDELKLTLEEIEEFKIQIHNYKKTNLNPTLEGLKSSIALGLTELVYNDTQGVCLSTVHTMKGQESDIVFLIGMDNGTFPDYRAQSVVDLQQERNNTYVAFTRAKRFLYISYPKKRLMPWGKYKEREISPFLKSLI